MVSPNLYHCVTDEVNRAFTCELVGVNHFWVYLKPYAHRGHPRVFSLDGSTYLDSAAAAVVSFPSRDRSSFQFRYGDYTRHQWIVTVTRANSPGAGHNWLNARLFKRDISESDDQFELVGSGSVLLPMESQARPLNSLICLAIMNQFHYQTVETQFYSFSRLILFLDIMKHLFRGEMERIWCILNDL